MGGCTSKDKTVAENEGCVDFFSLLHYWWLLCVVCWWLDDDDDETRAGNFLLLCRWKESWMCSRVNVNDDAWNLLSQHSFLMSTHDKQCVDGHWEGFCRGGWIWIIHLKTTKNGLTWTALAFDEIWYNRTLMWRHMNSNPSISLNCSSKNFPRRWSKLKHEIFTSHNVDDNLSPLQVGFTNMVACITKLKFCRFKDD